MKKYIYYLEDKDGNITLVSRNSTENIWYIFKKIEAPRNINPKSKRKADECLIISLNDKNMENYCHKNKLNLCRYWEETDEE